MRSNAPVLAVALALLLALASGAQQPPDIDRFHRAIRAGDTAALRALVAAEGPNVKDDTGMTPLILATAFGTRAAAQLLLQAGADVKAATNGGVTALHLAWHDEDLARDLLARGADVDAKSQIGVTPLTAAASAVGSERVVALLLDTGANVNAAENRGVTPLLAAAAAGNTAAAKLLLARGADPHAYAPGIGYKFATALMGAAHSGDVELTRLLLARKPDLNAKSPDRDANVKNGPVAYGELAALHLAIAAPSLEVVTLLLDAGAAVDTRDVRGLTPLAWAVGTDRPDPRIVRLLLDRGADPLAASKDNETPRDWARKYNNPAILRLLKMTPASAPAAAPAARPAHVPVTPEHAVARSLPLLRTGSSRVMRGGGCVACHAQPMTAAATEYVTRRGWRAEPVSADVAQVVTSVTSGVSGFLQGREAGGLPDSAMFSTFALAAMKTPPSVATDAFVSYLLAKQRREGHWHSITTRPPIQDGDINKTALAVRALTYYGIPARKAEIAARVARAAQWLAAERPMSTEERVMQLLGLAWAGRPRSGIEARIRKLLAEQRADGGWGQTPNLASDAYATGQVLFTLRELGVKADNAAVRRGTAYLLRTQAPDGSWHVRSRAMKIQPYFESGFPHGHDQWISQSGTAWAVIALAMSE